MKEADGRHSQVSRGVSEPDEGQPGHDTGAEQNQSKRPMRWPENWNAPVRQAKQVEDSNRTEEHRFQEETGDGGGPG